LVVVFALWASSTWTMELNLEVQDNMLLQNLASGIENIKIPKKESKILTTAKNYTQCKRGILKALQEIFNRAQHQPTNLIVSNLIKSFCLQKREKHVAKFYIYLNDFTRFNDRQSAEANKLIEALREAMRFTTLSHDKTPPYLYRDFIKFLIDLIAA